MGTVLYVAPTQGLAACGSCLSRMNFWKACPVVAPETCPSQSHTAHSSTTCSNHATTSTSTRIRVDDVSVQLRSIERLWLRLWISSDQIFPVHGYVCAISGFFNHYHTWVSTSACANPVDDPLLPPGPGRIRPRTRSAIILSIVPKGIHSPIW
jgi:hypothetical protein